MEEQVVLLESMCAKLIEYANTKTSHGQKPLELEILKIKAQVLVEALSLKTTDIIVGDKLTVKSE